LFKHVVSSSSIAVREVSCETRNDVKSKTLTYLVLFAGSPHARLSKTLCDGVTAEVVGIRLRNVVKLALEQFASSIFALTLDLANTWNSIDDGLEC